MVYRRHVGSVFRRARHLLGNDADAEEVVHDVFLSLHERPDQFEGRSSMTTYLYSLTTHACLNRLRNERTRARLLRERATPARSEAAQDLSPEQWVTLRARLAALEPPLAEVAIYYYIDELTQQEIARIIGCSRSQIGNYLHEISEFEACDREAAC